VTTLLARRSQFHQGRLAGNISLSNLQLLQAQNQAGAMFVQHGSDKVTSTHQALGFLYARYNSRPPCSATSTCFA